MTRTALVAVLAGLLLAGGLALVAHRRAVERERVAELAAGEARAQREAEARTLAAEKVRVEAEVERLQRELAIIPEQVDEKSRKELKRKLEEALQRRRAATVATGEADGPPKPPPPLDVQGE